MISEWGSCARICQAASARWVTSLGRAWLTGRLASVGPIEVSQGREVDSIRFRHDERRRARFAGHT